MTEEWRGSDDMDPVLAGHLHWGPVPTCSSLCGLIGTALWKPGFWYQRAFLAQSLGPERDSLHFYPKGVGNI